MMVLTSEQKKALPKLLEFAKKATYVRSNHLERIDKLSKESLTFEIVNYTEHDARALNAVRQYYIVEQKLNKQLGI